MTGQNGGVSPNVPTQKRHKKKRPSLSPKKTREGVTAEQMKTALTAYFLGVDGRRWGCNEAARRVEGVTRGNLQRVIHDTCKALEKLGHDYPPPAPGKRRVLPNVEEGSRLQKDLHKAIALYNPPFHKGRWAPYFTPDEEKLLVDIVEQRDNYGFGLDRAQLQRLARSWARAGGMRNVDCGRRWYHSWLKRAKEYKPYFGESKRSKMDVMRAMKQSPAVIAKFFTMVRKIYAHHKTLGHFLGDEPDPEDVYNVDEVHANPEVC